MYLNGNGDVYCSDNGMKFKIITEKELGIY